MYNDSKNFLKHIKSFCIEFIRKSAESNNDTINDEHIVKRKKKKKKKIDIGSHINSMFDKHTTIMHAQTPVYSWSTFYFHFSSIPANKCVHTEFRFKDV